MSARDEFPLLNDLNGALGDEAQHALDAIDRLRADVQRLDAENEAWAERSRAVQP